MGNEFLRNTYIILSLFASIVTIILVNISKNSTICRKGTNDRRILAIIALVFCLVSFISIGFGIKGSIINLNSLYSIHYEYLVIGGKQIFIEIILPLIVLCTLIIAQSNFLLLFVKKNILIRPIEILFIVLMGICVYSIFNLYGFGINIFTLFLSMKAVMFTNFVKIAVVAISTILILSTVIVIVMISKKEDY